MPRYWEACRTFITSRDSLTRNAHPISHTPEQRTCSHPEFSTQFATTGCVLVSLMSSTPPDRQALLFCSCPKNIGNLRQFAWYCRQAALLIEYTGIPIPYILRFSSKSGLSARTVILCSHRGRRPCQFWISPFAFSRIVEPQPFPRAFEDAGVLSNRRSVWFARIRTGRALYFGPEFVPACSGEIHL
jgi:hypothetical protein